MTHYIIICLLFGDHAQVSYIYLFSFYILYVIFDSTFWNDRDPRTYWIIFAFLFLVSSFLVSWFVLFHVSWFLFLVSGIRFLVARGRSADPCRQGRACQRSRVARLVPPGRFWVIFFRVVSHQRALKKAQPLEARFILIFIGFGSHSNIDFVTFLRIPEKDEVDDSSTLPMGLSI